MNLPTLLVALAVAAAVGAVILRGIRSRRRGKTGCACGGDCSRCGGCH